MDYLQLKTSSAFLFRKLGIYNFIRPIYKILNNKRYLYYYLQGKIRNYSWREKVKSLERYISKIPNKNLPLLDNLQKKNLEELRDKGITHNINLFTIKEIVEIKDFFKEKKLYDPYHYELGEMKKEDFKTLPPILHYSKEAIIKCPYILERSVDPKIYNILMNHFKCNFILDTIDIWWSFPQESGQGLVSNPQMYHRDLDSLNFVKYFVYLTDVDDNSGPHVFIEKSHLQKENIKQDKCYDDLYIESKFPKEDKKVIVGSMGSNFLANTFAFHKGLRPTGKPRLLLQFIYSVRPSPFSPVKPLVKIKNNPYLIDSYKKNRYFYKNYIK